MGTTAERRPEAQHSTVQGASRRAVLTGVAWAAPTALLATAAPALAVSKCSSQERIAIGWKQAARKGTPTTTGTFSNTVLFTLRPQDRLQTLGTVPAGTPAPLTLTLTHTFAGRMQGIANNGLIIDEGGPAANPDIFYDIRQHNGPSGTTSVQSTDYQLVKFSFSSPLRGLIFSIARIDQSYERRSGGIFPTVIGRDAIDGVSLASVVGYTSTPPRPAGDPNGSIVTGTGSETTPWRSNALDSESITLRGQIDVFFSDSVYVKEFTLKVRNLSTVGSPADNRQRVAVRGFLGWRDLC